MRRVVAPVALAMVMALTATACSLTGEKSSGYKLTAWFPRAVALYPSSDVRVLGLSAGKVDDVDAIGNRVRVTMHVHSDVPVPKDVNAVIVPQSLIGERYVQLFPAWENGEARAQGGTVIPLERTSIPVEPDEALAALKKFLDTLDPKATGRLVSNLAKDLDGTGESLNQALEGLGGLAATVASKDEELGRIIDHFDGFSATLATREQQLGRIMDNFAQLTSLLAEERRHVEGLVKGLGQVSSDALDLVSEHGARLDRDLGILTRTLQSVDANMDSVRQFLDAGPILVHGLKGAVDNEFHRVDLRTQFSPTAQQALEKVLGPLGVPLGDVVCVPADVACQPSGAPVVAPSTPAPAAAPAAGLPTVPAVPNPLGPRAAGAPSVTLPSLPSTTTTSITVPPNPIDRILGVFGSGGGRGAAAIVPQPSMAERLGHGVGGVGRFFRRAAAGLLGASR
jgi:phospholipid/cholesterol/gamma-HCH transport system substrate-binding protein